MKSFRLPMFVAAVALTATSHAFAAWPERPITIVVPAAPGGTTDMASRLLSTGLTDELGQPVVVENKAGAAGIIGAQQLVRSAPDGYTLLMGNIGPNAINYSLYKNLSYQPAGFVPVTLVVSVPNVLVVNSDLPVKSVKDLIEWIGNNPDKAMFGSSGAGQSPHLSAEMFKQRTGINATHVPYKGAGPAVTGLLGNEFAFMIDNLPSSLPQIRAGKFRALAVTSDSRAAGLPDVPTMAEAGVPDMVVTAWFGLFAPAGTPAAVVEKIQQSTQRVLESTDIRKRFEDMGGKPGGNTPAEFAAFVEAERARWKETVDRAGLSFAQ